MEKTRLEILRDGEWLPFVQPLHYTIKGDLLMAGGTHKLDLFLALSALWPGPYKVITAFREFEQRTHYFSVDVMDLAAWAENPAATPEMLQTDSRFELTIHTAGGPVCGMDEHDQMWFRGNFAPILETLQKEGYTEGPLEIPMPHRHPHRPEHDDFGKA